MISNKKLYIPIIFLKYLVLFQYFPILESERYTSFFELCISLSSCLNPYSEILNLDNGFLTFPYGNFMYFVLLPFFLIGSSLGISFVILSYLFFEILLIFFLNKTYQVDNNQLIFIVILNPFLIYSSSFLGQLDFIPLTYLILAIYYLKEKKKYISIFFIVLAFSSKIIFVILLPVFLIYFFKIEETLLENSKTILFIFFSTLLMNFQFFTQNYYSETVLFGINEGYNALNNSPGLFNNNFLIVAVFLSFIIFVYWVNIHRFDFYSISIFSSFLTIPLFITNPDNLGWFLWSFLSVFIIYYSYNIIIKIFILLFLSSIVFFNVINFEFSEITRFTIILGCIFFIYFGYQLIINNQYFKIKSNPIIIALAGDSAVGKTTLSKTLNLFFGMKFVDNIELDSFHLHERSSPIWKEYTHLNPQMNNLQEYKNTILNLMKGKKLLVKNYNHLNGKFDSESSKQINNFLIIEGLHSMYFTDLVNKFDLNVYLDLKESIKQESKLERDLARGKSKEEIIEQIKQRKNDYESFIKPQIKNADLYIKTLNRDSEKITFELRFGSSYFDEFKSEIIEFLPIEIRNLDSDFEHSKFEITIQKDNIKRLHSLLIKKIKNLQSQNYIEAELEDEVLIKMGIVLYLLEKKVSEKI